MHHARASCFTHTLTSRVQVRARAQMFMSGRGREPSTYHFLLLLKKTTTFLLTCNDFHGVPAACDFGGASAFGAGFQADATA